MLERPSFPELLFSVSGTLIGRFGG